MNRLSTLIYFSAIILFVSCKDDPKTTPSPIEIEDEWPTFVDTGANIVAYKVDGKVRVSKNISKLDSTKGFISCFYLLHEKYKFFSFNANRISDETFEGIQITLYDLKDTGYYKITSVDSQLVGMYQVGLIEASAKQFTTNLVDTGRVHITKIDTMKGIITGRFEFTGRYVFGSERKIITEGRFDLKYYR